jgi:hypothetical protein
MKFVDENNGYFPVKIQALPEGTCVHAHVPVYQVNTPLLLVEARHISWATQPCSVIHMPCALVLLLGGKRDASPFALA